MKRNPIFKIIRTYFTKQQLFYSLFFALIVITISSCKDECDKVNTRYDIAPELKDFYFKKGTYWVYEDTVNHVVDSRSVYSDTIGYQYGSTKTVDGSYCSVGNQFFNYYVQSTRDFGNDTFLTASIAGNLSSTIVVSGVGVPFTANIVFGLNTNIGQLHPNIIYNGLIYQKINGISYNNVYWYSIIIGKGSGNDYLKYNTDFYYVPKVGVVKKVEFGTPNGTRTWALKNYSVIQ